AGLRRTSRGAQRLTVPGAGPAGGRMSPVVRRALAPDVDPGGGRSCREQEALPERNAAMRKLLVINHMTLDGVMQAPGRPDEDTRGGFSRGGWAQAGNDQVMADFMGVGRGGDPGALLLGRRTYLDFFGFWPHQPDNPYT